MTQHSAQAPVKVYQAGTNGSNAHAVTLMPTRAEHTVKQSQAGPTPSASHQHLLQVSTGPAILKASDDVVDDEDVRPDGGGAASNAAVANHHNRPFQAMLAVHILSSISSLLSQPT